MATKDATASPRDASQESERVKLARALDLAEQDHKSAQRKVEEGRKILGQLERDAREAHATLVRLKTQLGQV